MASEEEAGGGMEGMQARLAGGRAPRRSGPSWQGGAAETVAGQGGLEATLRHSGALLFQPAGSGTCGRSLPGSFSRRGEIGSLPTARLGRLGQDGRSSRPGQLAAGRLHYPAEEAAFAALSRPVETLVDSGQRPAQARQRLERAWKLHRRGGRQEGSGFL